MFDIGFSELLIIFVIGLLVLGPERLPHAAKTAGLWIRKIRRSIHSVQSEINAQLDQEELQRKITETNKRVLNEEQSAENDTPEKNVDVEKNNAEQEKAELSTIDPNFSSTNASDSTITDDIKSDEVKTT
ncbi:Sec-independent protein translocase protein TatB [Marinomonas sp.]|nr:Sec-independent protein translocase protein TatB [Marinomonas sp.]MDB4837578.1 Sec-independent protein translocase protein TatB [Marinomonas sp.]